MDGDKIVHARAALRELVGQLGDGDRFARVSYADDAQVVAPLAPATDGARRGWLASVDGIVPGGGTNMSAGLDLGLATIAEAREGHRLPRVSLISDGLANMGDSSHQGLVARAQRCARGELPLTTVGVGTAFNEYLMSALADAGTGNYYYVQDATDLSQVFAREFGAARATVASGLAVEIEPGPGVRVVEAAGYPLEAAGDKIVFHPGALFAGQERRIWVTLAVPNDSPAEHALGRCTLAYSDGDVRKTIALPALPRIASVVSADDFFARVDPDLWARGVVVEDYSKMQHDVARLVKDGRHDQAVATMQRFRQQAAGMNGRLASPEVQRKLEALDALEASMADAFQGADQRAKQNALSKVGSAAAWDARRAGSKY
jgi:Ca-activated chloride channel family protein